LKECEPANLRNKKSGGQERTAGYERLKSKTGISSVDKIPVQNFLLKKN